MTLDSEGLPHTDLVERAPVSAELQFPFFSSMALLEPVLMLIIHDLNYAVRSILLTQWGDR